MRQVGSVLWPRLRALQVYGANTGVGKTVVSTLLCKALQRKLPDYAVHYLKPISTGPLHEADNRYVNILLLLEFIHSSISQFCVPNPLISHLSKFSKGIFTKNLVQFADPVSPHIAARGSQEVSVQTRIYTRMLCSFHNSQSMTRAYWQESMMK